MQISNHFEIWSRIPVLCGILQELGSGKDYIYNPTSLSVNNTVFLFLGSINDGGNGGGREREGIGSGDQEGAGCRRQSGEGVNGGSIGGKEAGGIIRSGGGGKGGGENGSGK